MPHTSLPSEEKACTAHPHSEEEARERHLTAFSPEEALPDNSSLWGECLHSAMSHLRGQLYSEHQVVWGGRWTGHFTSLPCDEEAIWETSVLWEGSLHSTYHCCEKEDASSPQGWGMAPLFWGGSCSEKGVNQSTSHHSPPRQKLLGWRLVQHSDSSLASVTQLWEKQKWSNVCYLAINQHRKYFKS